MFSLCETAQSSCAVSFSVQRLIPPTFTQLSLMEHPASTDEFLLISSTLQTPLWHFFNMSTLSYSATLWNAAFRLKWKAGQMQGVGWIYELQMKHWAKAKPIGHPLKQPKPRGYGTHINYVKCHGLSVSLSFFPSPITSIVSPSFPLTFPWCPMHIRPCPPGDTYHYHSVTALIYRHIYLLINDHAAKQHSRRAQTRHQQQNVQQILKLIQSYAWGSKKWSSLNWLRQLILSHLCKSIETEIQQSRSSCAASYLRVSVVLRLSVAVDEDPRSTQPCPPIWACICGADQRSALYLSAWRGGG